MDNAPERLRINGNVIDDIDGDFTGKPLCLSSGVEYIRADLHDATKAQLAKAVEALMEARLQLIYIDQLHRNGTTQTILARIIAVLDGIDKGAN